MGSFNADFLQSCRETWKFLVFWLPAGYLYLILNISELFIKILYFGKILNFKLFLDLEESVIFILWWKCDEDIL